MDGQTFSISWEISRALIRRTKKFCQRSEIAVMRPEGEGRRGTSPKVDNGLMNVNKLSKEVPDDGRGQWLPFPTISPSSSGPISPRRGRDKSVCCT